MRHEPGEGRRGTVEVSACCNHPDCTASSTGTPAERYVGTLFTDKGFEHVPALDHLQGWLAELWLPDERCLSNPGTTSGNLGDHLRG
jgi:hypothetical protein